MTRYSYLSLLLAMVGILLSAWFFNTNQLEALTRALGFLFSPLVFLSLSALALDKHLEVTIGKGF